MLKIDTLADEPEQIIEGSLGDSTVEEVVQKEEKK